LGAFESNFSTGLNELSADSQILLFPNPTHDYLNFNQRFTHIEIIDLMGKLVYSANNINQINIQSLLTGIYLIKAKTSNNSILIRKFIKI